MKEKEYQFSHCPYCNKQDLTIWDTGFGLDMERKQVTIKVECKDCKIPFAEIYQFVKTEKLKERNK